MVHLIANKAAIKIHFWKPFSSLVSALPTSRYVRPDFNFVILYLRPLGKAWLYLIIFGTQLNRIKRSWYNFIIITYSRLFAVPAESGLSAHALSMLIRFEKEIFCIEEIIILQRIQKMP